MDALLQWGKERDYPALWCPPYAIGPGEYCWRMFCGLAKPEALQAAIQAVMQTETPDVHTIEQKGA